MVWLFFETTTVGMLLAISVDRLLLVLMPLWHISRDASYAWGVLAVVYVYGFCDGTVGLYRSYTDTKNGSINICNTGMAFEATHQLWHYGFMTYGGMLSVVLY